MTTRQLRSTLCAVFLVAGCFASGCSGEIETTSPAEASDSLDISTRCVGSAMAGCSLSSLNYDWKYDRRVGNCRITGSDGMPLRVKAYVKTGPKAIVLFLAGRSEFAEKYDVLFSSLRQYPKTAVPWNQTLADLNISFFSLDHAGQGKSVGTRVPGHIDSYDHFVADVDLTIKAIRAVSPSTPIYLMAHSMGGLIAARYAETHPGVVAGLVLSSPMFGINPPPGVPIEQVQQLAMAYATPPPYGFGLADRCAQPPQHSLTTLGALAGCLADPGCGQCFMTPGCTVPGMDFAAMGAAWAWLQSPDSIGCKADATAAHAVDACTLGGPGFVGTTTDYNYCVYTETSPLHVGNPTFGWLAESFKAFQAFQASVASIRVPVLVLSSPIDPIVTQADHVAVCGALASCSLKQYPPTATGQLYLHELLTETLRQNPILAIRAFLKARI